MQKAQNEIGITPSWQPPPESGRPSPEPHGTCGTKRDSSAYSRSAHLHGTWKAPCSAKERNQPGTRLWRRFGGGVGEFQGLTAMAQVGCLQAHAAESPAVRDLVPGFPRESERFEVVPLAKPVSPLVHGHPTSRIREVRGCGEHVIVHILGSIGLEVRGHRVDQEGRGHGPRVPANTSRASRSGPSPARPPASRSAIPSPKGSASN